MSATVVLVQAADGPAWERSLAALREHLPEGAELAVLDGPPAEAAEAAAPADVVLVDAPVLVGAGWLDGLRDARETTAATVSPLVLRGEGAPPALDEAAGPSPRLEVPPEGIRLVRRAALQLAGPLDGGFADRCAARGLTHLLAPGVVALLPGEAPPAAPPEDPSHERPPGAVERARLLGARAAGGLTLTIDGRALGPGTAGTQVHTLELVRALVRTGRVRPRLVVPPDLGPASAAALAELPEVVTVDGREVPRGTERTQVVHRPYQLTSPDDVVVLRRLGHRVVVTHQDSILFHTAAYHPDAAAWAAYRRLTADGLAAADMVLAFTRHAAGELLADDLADPARLRVVELGAEHLGRGLAAAREPEGAAALRERPFLLCIGTDLRHKNRLFALDLLAALRERGWDGALVLAGQHLEPGGSAAEERARLAADRELAAAVLDLGPVEEGAKAWLYEHAAAVVYPSVVEGFGLVPFEAASAGTPALFAPQASLAELFGPESSLLVAWDAAASAERALPLLRDGAAAREQVERVRAAGSRLTWDATAERLLEVYDETLRMPASAAAVVAWRELEAQEGRSIAEGRYWALRNEIGPTGFALVGETGALPEDVQRTLAALSGREATRRPLFAALRGLRRLTGRR